MEPLYIKGHGGGKKLGWEKIFFNYFAFPRKTCCNLQTHPF